MKQNPIAQAVHGALRQLDLAAYYRQANAEWRNPNKQPAERLEAAVARHLAEPVRAWNIAAEARKAKGARNAV